MYIALKDINNYCYDSDVEVPVEIRIDGPYEHPDSEGYLAETRTHLVDFRSAVQRKIVEGKLPTDECSQYYEYTFTHLYDDNGEQKERFQTSGWYQIQVFINGKTDASVSIRQTYMEAGDFVEANTVVSVPYLAGSGVSGQYDLPVREEIDMRL